MHENKGEVFKASKTFYSKKWRVSDNKTNDCKTIDNIYNHSFESAIRKFPSIETLFENEDEFNELKSAYELKNSA